MTAAVLDDAIMMLEATIRDSDDVVMSLEPKQFGVLCSWPLIRDPYERKMVTCLPSSVSGAGQGLFMLKTVPAETIVAFYSGIRIPDSECDTDDTWDECSYRIFVDEESEERMDIPSEYLDLDKYCATLGHKVNHSFHPNCDFSTFEHPRFGRLDSAIN